ARTVPFRPAHRYVAVPFFRRWTERQRHAGGPLGDAGQEIVAAGASGAPRKDTGSEERGEQREVERRPSGLDGDDRQLFEPEPGPARGFRDSETGPAGLDEHPPELRIASV